MTKTEEENIKGKILFFSPNEEGTSYFTDSLIYICDHNDHGSLGLIFNRPLNLDLKELFSGMKIKDIEISKGNVFLGGPVNPGAIFILHSSDRSWQGTLEVTKNIHMTTNYQAIEDIAYGNGPKNYILTLGYTGWGPEQLNDEITDNAWIIFNEESELIFNTQQQEQISEMSKIVGYDIRMISPDFGNA